MSRVASSPVRDLLALTARPEVISFAGGLPAPELFDLDGWRAAFEVALDRRALQYAPTEGDPALRASVAARMTGAGLPTGAEDLLVTTGSQQALALVAAVLLRPGSVVAVEEPTYLAALQCFRLAGAHLVPVASDEDGMDPSALEDVLRRFSPALVYLVPTFANPTGRTLSAERRAAIAALAASYDTWVVEDDPYGELRYRGASVAPLASWGDRVLYLGSLSKIGAPGLRLGWLRAPESLRQTVVVAKQAADLHTSTVDQAAAAAYLAVTDLDAHVAILRHEYSLRRTTMIAALPSAFPPGTTWTDTDGGMFVWVHLPPGHSAGDLLPPALKENVAFVPGAPFYATTPDPATLRLSFTTSPPAEIEEGMTRLRRALRHHWT